MWVTSKLCNVRAYSQYVFSLPKQNSTVHIVWNINRGRRGVNGSARRDGPFTPGWPTYFRTFVLRGVSDMVSTGRIFIHRLNRQWGGGVSVMWVNSKLCNVRAYRQYPFGLPYLNSTVHIVWNINRGQGGVNGSARRSGPCTPEWTTYSRTLVLSGVSAMVSTGRMYRHRVIRQCVGVSVMWVTSKLCNVRAYSQYTFGLPSWIPQYILYEILTEAREGWTGQSAVLARSLPSELRTSAHLFWGGFPSW